MNCFKWGLPCTEALPLGDSREFAVEADVQIRRSTEGASGGEIKINFVLKSLSQTTLEDGNVALWLPDGLLKNFPDFFVDNLYELRPSGSGKVELKPGVAGIFGISMTFQDYTRAQRIRRFFEQDPSYVQVTGKGGKRTLEIPGSVWQIRVDE